MGTSSVVSAAVAGGESMLVFSLAVAGAIIVLLLAMVIWFAKDRVKARRLYEETLEKRLSSGADINSKQSVPGTLITLRVLHNPRKNS